MPYIDNPAQTLQAENMPNRSSTGVFLGYTLHVMPCPYSEGEWKAAVRNPDSRGFTNLEGPYGTEQDAKRDAERQARLNAAKIGTPIPDYANPIWEAEHDDL